MAGTAEEWEKVRKRGLLGEEESIMMSTKKKEKKKRGFNGEGEQKR